MLSRLCLYSQVQHAFVANDLTQALSNVANFPRGPLCLDFASRGYENREEQNATRFRALKTSVESRIPLALSCAFALVTNNLNQMKYLNINNKY